MYFYFLVDNILFLLVLVVFDLVLLLLRLCIFWWVMCHVLCLLIFILDYIFLYFLLLRLRIVCRILGLFGLQNEELILSLHRLKYGFLRGFFFLFVWLLRNICRHSHWWIPFYLKQLFHHLFGDSLIFVCLILSILVLVVFGRIFGVLCNVEPFLSVNIIVFYQITPINQLFACICS